MRPVFQFIVFIFLLGLASCSETPAIEHTDHPVGLKRLTYSDPVRKSWSGEQARPLNTYIWYPASNNAIMTKVGIPPERPVFTGGAVARNAEFAADDSKYPLVIMSHGTGGSAMQMMWLGRELAAQGYIAVAVDHHGNTAAEDHFDARGFRLPWERALDISAVLDQLLVDPQFATKIDRQRISAIGFSLGGYTVTALAGGIFDFELFNKFCSGAMRDASCDDQSEYPEASAEFEKLRKTDPRIDASLARSGASFKDTRIRSVITLAPAPVQAFTRESLEDIDIPFLVFVGSADKVAPATTNAMRLAKLVPNVQIQIIKDAGHYVFLSLCNKRGRKYVPVCRDPKGVRRDITHSEVIKKTLEFLNRQPGE